MEQYQQLTLFENPIAKKCQDYTQQLSNHTIETKNCELLQEITSFLKQILEDTLKKQETFGSYEILEIVIDLAHEYAKQFPEEFMKIEHVSKIILSSSKFPWSLQQKILEEKVHMIDQCIGVNENCMKTTCPIIDAIQELPSTIFLSDMITTQNTLDRYLSCLLQYKKKIGDKQTKWLDEQILNCDVSTYTFTPNEEKTMTHILEQKANALSRTILDTTIFHQNEIMINGLDSLDGRGIQQYLKTALECYRNYAVQYSPFTSRYGFLEEAQDRICCLIIQYYNLLSKGGTIEIPLQRRLDQLLYWEFETWSIENSHYIPKQKQSLYCLLRFQSYQRFGHFLASNVEVNHQMQYQLKK